MNELPETVIVTDDSDDSGKNLTILLVATKVFHHL